MFIVFEGVDGSGKTTLLKSLFEYIKSNGISCVKTCEPGGTDVGKHIRALIPSVRDCLAQFLLFAADRAEHVSTCIKPALEHSWVLCDRYTDSSLVYQGYIGNIDTNFIKQVNISATQGIMPDITFYCRVSYKVALSRRHERATTYLFDKADEKYSCDLIKGFEHIYKNDIKTVHVLNCDESKASVFYQAKQIIDRLL